MSVPPLTVAQGERLLMRINELTVQFYRRQGPFLDGAPLKADDVLNFTRQAVAEQGGPEYKVSKPHYAGPL